MGQEIIQLRADLLCFACAGLACFLLLVVRTRQAIDELQAQRRSRQPPSMILRFIRKTSRSVIMAGVITVGVVLLFSLVIGWATSTIRLKGEDTTAWCSKQLGIQVTTIVCLHCCMLLPIFNCVIGLEGNVVFFFSW